MGYDEDTVREVRRGFEYDPDRLDNLGVVERNGVRLIYNRMDGYLRVERTDPTLETIAADLRRVMGDD